MLNDLLKVSHLESDRAKVWPGVHAPCHLSLQSNSGCRITMGVVGLVLGTTARSVLDNLSYSCMD
jgi:hypothetical protein